MQYDSTKNMLRDACTHREKMHNIPTKTLTIVPFR